MSATQDGPARTILSLGGERVVLSGVLSRRASFCLIVTGPVGIAELDRLIEKLTIDKAILGEAEAIPAAPTDAAMLAERAKP